MKLNVEYNYVNTQFRPDEPFVLNIGI